MSPADLVCVQVSLRDRSPLPGPVQAINGLPTVVMSLRDKLKIAPGGKFYQLCRCSSQFGFSESNRFSADMLSSATCAAFNCHSVGFINSTDTQPSYSI